MPIYALPRVVAFLKNRFEYVFKKNPYPGTPMVNLIPIEGDSGFVIDDLIHITPIHILHGDLPILGYRIGTVAYLTDVKSIPEPEFEKLKNLKILIISALRYLEHHSHLTLEQAVELAQKIDAEKTYFIHFSHLLGPHEKIMAQLPENIFAAHDQLTIEI